MSGAVTAERRPATEGCRYCWMCRHVCPVGAVSSRETFTPHAWALTIESVRRGQLAWNAETAGVLYACADCGLCQTHCVTDQPLPDAIVAARAEVVGAGEAPTAVRQYRDQLTRTALAGAGARRPADSGSSARALFVGSAASADGDEVSAAVALLDAAGQGVARMAEGLDTGLTASALGLVEEARQLAERVVAAVTDAGVRELFVVRPADRWAFEHVYPVRLGVAWPADVSVLDVTTVLARRLDSGALRFTRGEGPKVAYHDPCHAPRLERDADAPRRLLAAVHPDGSIGELFWRRERAHPCGAIGGLAVTHPEMARQLTAARHADASAGGASVLVTDDPVCLAELRQHVSDTLQVSGLYALLAARLG